MKKTHIARNYLPNAKPGATLMSVSPSAGHRQAVDGETQKYWSQGRGILRIRPSVAKRWAKMRRIGAMLRGKRT